MAGDTPHASLRSTSDPRPTHILLAMERAETIRQEALPESRRSHLRLGGGGPTREMGRAPSRLPPRSTDMDSASLPRCLESAGRTGDRLAAYLPENCMTPARKR